MKRNYLLYITGFMIIMGILSGCKNRTVVTETTYFPSSASAATAEYTLFIQMYGERGKAFVDTSKKQVVVYIKHKEDVLLEDAHEFEAGEFEPQVVWNEAGRVSIDFVSTPSKQNVGEKMESLLRLEYMLDNGNGKFHRI